MSTDADTGPYYVEVRHGGCRHLLEFPRVPNGLVWGSLVPLSDAAIDELITGDDYEVAADCIGPTDPELALDTAMGSIVDDISEDVDWHELAKGWIPVHVRMCCTRGPVAAAARPNGATGAFYGEGLPPDHRVHRHGFRGPRAHVDPGAPRPSRSSTLALPAVGRNDRRLNGR